MSAIDQYLALYDEHRALLDGGSCAAMNALRDEARTLLSAPSTALPAGGESYAHTSLERMFEPDYGINLKRLPLAGGEAAAAETFRCGAGAITPWLITVTGDVPALPSPLRPELPEGVVFAPMTRAPQELLEKYYGSVARMEGNTETALNTLLAQDGVMIYVPHGVKMPRPLQIVNLNVNAPQSLMSVRRVLVVAEEDAEVKLLVCDHSSADDASGATRLNSQVIEVVAARNARVELYDIEETSPLTRRDTLVYARQAGGSEVRMNFSTLQCGITRNDVDVTLTEPEATTHLTGMAICSGHMRADLNSRLRHDAPHCKSRQLFKYVVDDEAVGAFEGLVIVAPGAKGTDAEQTNRNLLASYGAKMHSKPQLEIYNDDVKCSHGSSTGRLDANALFYMEARGIPEADARTMLMQAFLMDVIDSGIGIESLRGRIRHMAERRFSGAGICASCMDTPAADNQE